MSELEEVLKDPNSLAFLVYKGIEGAMNAVEEIKVGKSAGIYKKGVSKDFLKDTIELLMRKYTAGSIKKKIFLKAAMSLPWSDTMRILYDVLLGFGEKGNGSYKSTKDTIFDALGKYLGE